MSRNNLFETYILIKNDILQGLSQRVIAERRSVCKTTVANIAVKIKNDMPLTIKFGSGRPKKLSKEMKVHIFKIYESNHMLSVEEILFKFNKKYNLNISRFTISRTLKDFGLITAKPAKKPLLRPQNIKKRYDISKKFLGISNDTLNSIIWSDECKFNLFTSDGIRYVRYLKGERYSIRNTLPTVKHGGGNLMFWGCISSKGVGRLIEIESTMTAAAYKQILAQNLNASAREMGLEDYIFMHDNDPKHTSRLLSDWFDEKNIDVLEWPAQSPDLNPIEALWALVKSKLAKLGKLKKPELRSKILEIWYSIPDEVVKKYVKSFYKRVLAVYSNKGNNTKY